MSEPVDRPVLYDLARGVFWVGPVLYLPIAFVFSAMFGWGQQLSYVLGKRMFLDLGLFFLPALAALGFLEGEGWGRFAKALLLGAVGAVGLGFGAAVAMALYPQYPSTGPHELVACAFVLPAVGLPFSGCIERLTWVNGTLSYEHHCDWGI